MYITTPLSARNPQIPIDVLWDFDGVYADRNFDCLYDPSATLTRIMRDVPKSVYEKWRPEYLMIHFQRFVEEYPDIIDLPDYRPLYRHYEIPKKNGKMRPIDEPTPRLKQAQKTLAELLKQDCPATHHAAAYAYIEQREPIKAVQKHQKNNSNWFAKFDFTNFFGSTTPRFVSDMLSQIYPFAWMCQQSGGRELMDKVLSICFLNGGLPQGSPISPLLTNIMMIPIDHKLMNALLDYDRHNFVYTRYADDMQISCKYTFNVKSIERLIEKTLGEFKAPFSLNKEKTHYGSRSGRNWMLGIMLNAENNTTVGYREKKYLKASITNYIEDVKAPVRRWELNEIQQLAGKIGYYRHIEKDYFDQVVAHLSEKFGVDVDEQIKIDIKAMTTGVA